MFFGQDIRLKFRVDRGKMAFPDPPKLRFMFYRKQANGSVDFESFQIIDAVIEPQSQPTSRADPSPPVR